MCLWPICVLKKAIDVIILYLENILLLHIMIFESISFYTSSSFARQLLVSFPMGKGLKRCFNHKLLQVYSPVQKYLLHSWTHVMHHLLLLVFPLTHYLQILIFLLLSKEVSSATHPLSHFISYDKFSFLSPTCSFTVLCFYT